MCTFLNRVSRKYYLAKIIKVVFHMIYEKIHAVSENTLSFPSDENRLSNERKLVKNISLDIWNFEERSRFFKYLPAHLRAGA